MKTLLVLSGLLAAGFVSPVFAANANHPYANCDKKVDNCGPTGNETTDQLNGQQLGSGTTRPDTMQPGMGTPGQPMQPMRQ